MALRNFFIIMNTFTALPFPFLTPKIKIEKVRGLFPLVLPSRGVTRLSLSTHFFMWFLTTNNPSPYEKSFFLFKLSLRTVFTVLLQLAMLLLCFSSCLFLSYNGCLCLFCVIFEKKNPVTKIDRLS